MRNVKTTMKTMMLAAIASCGLTLPAAAAPMVLQLTPGNMLAQTRSSAMMMSTTSTFRQLSGTLKYDPDTGACAIDATFVVLSMQMPNALMRSQTMSAGFLDPADYPLQRYVATCQGNQLVGTLTMHGQTHPFDMTVTLERTGGTLTGIHTEGALNRHDWGIDGLNLIVGKTIHVTNDISLNGQPPTPTNGG